MIRFFFLYKTGGLVAALYSNAAVDGVGPGGRTPPL